MPLDIHKLHRDTPATARFIHFNNAGAALMPAPVLQAQLDHLRLESETGGYEAAATADQKLEAVYTSIARLLNADPTKIALVESTLLDARARGLRDLVRASVHCYNTEPEVARFAAAVAALAR